MNELYTNKILSILKQQVKPARGCTEPIAVALATATTIKELKGEIKKINVRISPNIYKNGIRVGIPGTEEKGIAFAVALSVVCANPSLGLELFRDVNSECIENAKEIISRNIISIEIVKDRGSFYIEINIETEHEQGCCIIEESHTNIVYLKLNEKVLINKKKTDICPLNIGKNTNTFLKSMTIMEILEFIETTDFQNIKFLLQGVDLNFAIANKGLSEKTGVSHGLNQLIQNGIIKNDILNRVKVLTSAACDARMAGINMPVMSSAGSGNHGITAIIPPALIAKHLGLDDEKLSRALALSHLITAFIKEYTGKLSPVCGCSVAAGIGASASITWLLGGTYAHIVGAINNMVGSISGMVCDGAKGGCALKLSTAAGEAVMQAYLAVSGMIISEYDGIIGENVENTIKNLGILSNEGMKNMDDSIIKIMKI